jgi:prepilin-type N-terminal cleavage/methylation domain-containing protein
MKNTKGFTILEVMVAMSIFAIVTGAALALFQFQAKKGAGSAMRKVANEAVATATMQLRRDIARAGMGLLEGKEALSVFVVNGSSSAPDKLFLNFSDHLSMDIGMSSGSFFKIFKASGMSDSATSSAWWQLTGATQFNMPAISSSIDGTSVGGVILDAAPYYIDDSGGLKAQRSGTENYATRTHTLNVSWTTPVPGGNAAPAIVYSLSLDKPVVSATYPYAFYSWGRLLRNGVPIIGAADTEMPTAPGVPKTPVIKVTDFQVRCGFYVTAAKNFADYYTDKSKNTGWTPDKGVFGDSVNGYTALNLRVIEVAIRYIYKDKGGGNYYPKNISTPGFSIPNDQTPGPWAIGGLYTVTFSPRALVLGRQLGATPL